MSTYSTARLRQVLIVAALALLPLCSSSAFAADAQAAFARLGQLAGDWEGQFANGRHHTVNYRFSAGGTVLVETWALAPGRESITVYYVDGDELLATHYCPQGTQPRLRLVDDAGGRLSFELRDGGNLALAGKSHQQAFWLELSGENGYRRSETYVENGGAAQSGQADAPVQYRRIAAGDAPRI
ncbi:hypothetical protein [Tahibacter harae]|uniref:Uncharacterized protein n=1 Tax=Tahibacter harae TaxID=2963937 RepID=A0ABT1QW21_9GAMM|nr:hypothetical protein [Tahibacter harae]MCQ4166480.1 hypothetical protein [Tahibacter harae]